MSDYSNRNTENYIVTLSSACPAGRLSKCDSEMMKNLILYHVSLRQAQTDRQVYMKQYTELTHSSLRSN